jgi:hypothetical protein
LSFREIEYISIAKIALNQPYMKPNLLLRIAALLVFVIQSTVVFSQSPGESCQTAQPLAIPSVNTGPFEDNWYVIEPTVAGQYLISMCGLNTCDTRLWLYSSCPLTENDANSIIASNDDGCGLQSQLNVALLPGNTYLLRVGDFNTACTGSVTFSIESYEVIAGCTNPLASNFNPDANVENGSCIILGCTDTSALNFSYQATEDDGSCEYCSGTGSVIGDFYLCTFSNGYQLEVEIFDSNGNSVAELLGSNGAIQHADICLIPGECYTAVMTNNTGPLGWYNGYFWINGNGVQYINDELSPNAQTESVSFSIDGTCGPIVGCMDPNADNYNSEAQISDGSCVYSGCTDPNALNFDYSATFDDGSCDYCAINGTIASLYVCAFGNGEQLEMQILDGDGNEVIYVDNMTSGAIEYFNVCLVPGTCYTVNMINNAGPYGWYGGYYNITINGVQLSGTSLSSGLQYASTIFSIDGTCGPVVIPGCTDPGALNYNAEATIEDGSCQYPYYGCTDPAALNYDPLATESTECLYAEDCFQNMVTFTLGGSYWLQEMSFAVYNENGEMVAYSASGTSYVCLGDGCYTVMMFDSFGDGWDNGTLEVTANGEWVTSINLINGLEGTAAFGLNAEGCGPAIYGCTDATAFNYNYYATEDDGTCIYQSDCTEEFISVVLQTQIWGSEVGFSLLNEDGEIVLFGENFGSWETNVVYGCVPSGCYTLVMEDTWGDGWNGAYYVLSGPTSYSEGTLDWGSEGANLVGINSMCSDVEGCTDSTALNFNPYATFDDGSCVYNDNAGFIMNPSYEFDVALYPNPTGGNMVLEVTDVQQEEGIRMKIIGMDGSLVREEFIKTTDTAYRTNLDVSFLSAGYYFMQIQNGDQVKTHSFVKQ